MKLYASRAAPNPQKISLALHELGLAHERVEVDILARENRQPPFLAINPTGKLPVLDDDGFVLWESNAILSYLGRKHVEKGLWPTTPKEDADALRWLFFEISMLQPPVADIWGERWLMPRFMGGAGDEALVEKALPTVQRPLKVLDGHLAGREFMLGKFSLVDCAVAPVLNMLAVSAVKFDEHANVQRYFERVSGRESFKAFPLEFPQR